MYTTSVVYNLFNLFHPAASSGVAEYIHKKKMSYEQNTPQNYSEGLSNRHDSLSGSNYSELGGYSGACNPCGNCSRCTNKGYSSGEVNYVIPKL